MLTEKRNPAAGGEPANGAGAHWDGVQQNYSTADSTADAAVSLFTATNPSRLSKRYHLDQQGQLLTAPGGSLVRGEYRRMECGEPWQLATLIDGLRPDQALAFGVARAERSPVASRKAAKEGDITRTREHFDWPAAPGWLMLDYDPEATAKPLDRDGLLSVLREAWPDIERAPLVLGDSGSSHIYHADTGECVKGRGGLRCYVLVADARDIPRAGEVLHKRLWLAGHGFYLVSKSGALLERGPVDAVVWQPERLDFAAGAACIAPLEQRRPPAEPRNNDAAPIDTRATLPDLTAAELEELAELRRQEREAMAPDQALQREEWVEQRLDEIQPKDVEEARARLTDAVTNGRLYGDFVLHHQSGKRVTVGQVLDDPDRWHGQRFADPLEPDYRADSRIAWLNLRSGGRPFIYSHAHGGARYTLIRASATLKAQPGEMPRIVREADALMAEAGVVFQRGGQLVRVVEDGTLFGVQPPWLRTHLEEVAAWLRWDGRAKDWLPADAPGDLAPRILANRGGWSVPELTGVIRGPILRPDGSLLNQPGYDKATGLLLLADHPDGWPAIPAHPSREQVRAALATLWEPFARFPYVDDVSRAVQLAALLTAVQRPLLETAPAFAWNAYRAGTGKSKGAKATAWLGGSEPVESPWSEQAEEQRKRLMSALMAGPSSLLLDNVSGPMDSDTLCAVLTASEFRDRKLGVSEDVSAPTRVLVAATGNNLRLVGDLSRRVLVATIDHGVENPERLAFPFDPVARVRERWLHYRAAALTVLRGFLAEGAPAHGLGTMGSYEQWDALIRQCVVWVRAEGLAGFSLADPADAVARNYDNDPETQKLRALVAAWHAQHAAAPVRVATLISTAGGDVDGCTFPQYDEGRAALLEALQEIAGDRGYVNRRRLGRWIERHAGRVVDGLRIESAGEAYKTRQWRVVQV
ncbi:hypothetical protein ACN2MM_05965 [Alkalilimnicola ehrlichii MLHE-1]|uniref:DNA primase/polymerase bifunctional N-terminal domain-containing protein n=1 Tax=Alkalilimnicola ehrlichii (strain ATCC BAA-1101 / DSM 17681 / MLHE-1) TaxID=187272 RepID=Q0A9S2_ALKEH|nr:hypothetical protein [Alkalilimnicola ehrlichii]ABI56415.1 conserved hypothetical protein [Alkalilimnicola ehrlichii MLHE-1]